MGAALIQVINSASGGGGEAEFVSDKQCKWGMGVAEFVNDKQCFFFSILRFSWILIFSARELNSNGFHNLCELANRLKS